MSFGTGHDTPISEAYMRRLTERARGHDPLYLPPPRRRPAPEEDPEGPGLRSIGEILLEAWSSEG